ncbi:MAG: hypothetical protein RLZ10_237 [Bacteroidota bacterium]|jgi:hypothetical protein
MENYNKFMEELSVYKNSSVSRIKFAIFVHKFFRIFTTKTFEFIATLGLMMTFVTLIMGGITIGLILSTAIVHFLYWIIIYPVISKVFENDLYELFTLRIRILENILETKKRT